MRPTDAHLVRALPLFCDMAQPEFDALMQASYLQRFPAHVELVAEGDSADFLHVIVDGMVELYATHGDRETSIVFLSPVSTFILAAVLVDKIHLQSARTLHASRILMIPAELIRAVFQRDGAFARAVVNEMAERYREVIRELKDQKVRTGLERLAGWILRNATVKDGILTTLIPFEKGKLASRLGMTRENLSRTFVALESYDLTVTGRTINCRDPAALESLARLNRLIDEV
ncbi:cyclic nucleotide-binding domain-containing protein [Phreatobacter aquaticus]|uniref:Cyclic nucleotide-binding domain-containing protein n=1 Tax=Phreatobacter aquaticus TaxID=2570229 RepID=A0A4D7QEL4_9HYPH|nr:cyclic nucleotide-binding domain-containing protein [Phreatobacter aquaticus]QCK85608.1 cyclic nucleotide-binding domain-containing protein [Phreatobacter aquaticus]